MNLFNLPFLKSEETQSLSKQIRANIGLKLAAKTPKQKMQNGGLNKYIDCKHQICINNGCKEIIWARVVTLICCPSCPNHYGIGMSEDSWTRLMQSGNLIYECLPDSQRPIDMENLIGTWREAIQGGRKNGLSKNGADFLFCTRCYFLGICWSNFRSTDLLWIMASVFWLLT